MKLYNLIKNDPKNNQRNKTNLQTLSIAPEGQKRNEVAKEMSAPSFLTEELKTQIRAFFDRLVYTTMEEIVEELDYEPYDDEDKLIEEAEQRAKEKIEYKFEEHNNWIGEDDFEDEACYEKAKKEIIEFVNKL